MKKAKEEFPSGELSANRLEDACKLIKAFLSKEVVPTPIATTIAWEVLAIDCIRTVATVLGLRHLLNHFVDDCCNSGTIPP